MTLISKEAVMSSRRIVISCAALVCGVLAGSWYAVKAFPLMAQAPGVVQAGLSPAGGSSSGPLEQNAKAITPENPIPRRTYSVMPPYPGAAGTVAAITLRITINALGRVAELRALERVLFSGNVEIVDGDRRISANRVSSGAAPGSEVLLKAAIDAVRQWVYEPPADAPISFDITLLFTPGSETRLLAHGGPLGVQGGSVAGAAEGPAPPPPPPPPPAPWTREGAMIDNPVRIGGDVLAPTKVKDVRPMYSPEAMAAHVQGVVILEAIIGPSGRVDQVRVLRGIQLLDQAAMDAVKEWEFTPTLRNGVAVPVMMTVSINFTLK
jgi:TonB family protein